MSIVRLVDGEEQSIPAQTRDYAGSLVDLRGVTWRLNDPISSASLNWRSLGHCDQRCVAALKLHIVRLIETRSPAYVSNTFRYVASYLKALTGPLAPSTEVNIPSLLWYLDSLRTNQDEYRFHHVRIWYRASADRLIEGFDAETSFALDDLRIPGNKKGFAVQSADPDEGPLSEFEEMALRRALVRDTGPIEERAALWLSLAFGPNPANLALLREEDYRRVAFDGVTPAASFLNLPRIKKRVPTRSLFKLRYVDEPLARIIEELIQRNGSVLNADVRPLFARSSPRRSLLAGPLKDYAFHYSAAEIAALISRCVSRLDVVSPRTGQRLAVTPRRLRYTFATKMVRQGIGPRELAELLDHTDTQNVQVYYDFDSQFVERLDATIAKELGPQVRAFMGKILPKRGHSIDLIPFRDLPDLGQCGASFVCGLAPPKNCYTCTKFRAFKNGPHEAVLDSLLKERSELLEAGHDRIAEQLDETILAVGEVITRPPSCDV